ncbi:MAG: hypothetical protein AAB224_07590 [Gemmatimonadota bacterium]
MRWTPGRLGVLRRIASTVAVVFGLATVMAGGRVLLGADPGYVVYRPLLVFNTVMGVAYVVAGVAIWRDLSWSRSATVTILVLNVAVLGAILLLYATGAAVAVDSLRAMTLRSVVWLTLFVALVAIRQARA